VKNIYNHPVQPRKVLVWYYLARFAHFSLFFYPDYYKN